MQTRRSIVRAVFASSLTLAGLSLFVGCADGGRTHAYRMNPTPEIETQAGTDDENVNRIVMTHDTNFRVLKDDAARMFFLDRPSRLTPNRVTY